MLDFDPSELDDGYVPSQDFTCDHCHKPESIVGSLRCIVGGGIDLQLCQNCYAKWKRKEGTKVYLKSEADKVMSAYEARIKELESMLKDKDEAMDTCRGLIESANVMSKDAKDKLLNRIKKLVAENERLKAMKWISVDDVKPQWGKEVKVKFKDGSEDEVRFSHDYKWISKGMATCESSEVTHWMPLPPPPTNEESSATEKDNG